MSSDLREELTCSICLNVFSDPVLLRCGHNFCLVCIWDVLDTQDGAGVYTCPVCRAEFKKRPALRRNLKLRSVAEHFLTAQPEKDKSGRFCTYCVHALVPAAKTCLHCEASLCDLHLCVHKKTAEHVLTEPIPSMENRKCSVHEQILKYYCPQDSVCVCVSCCLVGEHRGHKVYSVNDVMEEKKERMRQTLEEMTLMRERTRKRVQGLQIHKSKVQDEAARLTERVNVFIQEIRGQLIPQQEGVLSQISGHKDQVSFRVTVLIRQIEKRMKDLFWKMRHLRDLCEEPDPFIVLQDQESDDAVFTDTEKEDEEERSRYSQIITAVGDLDEVLISLSLQRALADIIADVTIKCRFCVPEPSDVLLDVDTAANNVFVSSDSKKASVSKEDLGRPSSPGRFQSHQVFSANAFASGRHYWEVEISSTGLCRVGASYPSVKKNGNGSFLGNNRESWCLQMLNNEYAAIHNLKQHKLGTQPFCSRFGIFLDYDAGRLSFYELCDPVRHLHTFTARFTEPLHAAFTLDLNGWARVSCQGLPTYLILT